MLGVKNVAGLYAEVGEAAVELGLLLAPVMDGGGSKGCSNLLVPTGEMERERWRVRWVSSMVRMEGRSRPVGRRGIKIRINIGRRKISGWPKNDQWLDEK